MIEKLLKIQWNKSEHHRVYADDWKLSYQLRTLGSGQVNAILSLWYKDSIVDSYGALSKDLEEFHLVIKTFLQCENTAIKNERYQQDADTKYAKLQYDEI